MRLEISRSQSRSQVRFRDVADFFFTYLILTSTFFLDFIELLFVVFSLVFAKRGLATVEFFFVYYQLRFDIISVSFVAFLCNWLARFRLIKRFYGLIFERTFLCVWDFFQINRCMLKYFSFVIKSSVFQNWQTSYKCFSHLLYI